MSDARYHASFGLLGVPVDGIDLASVVEAIDRAAIDRKPMLVSTINANFLAQSQRNAAFKASLVTSDVCTVDGIAVLLLCKLLGVNNIWRASGADILDILCTRADTELGRPLRVFFFGGEAGIAASAQRCVNAKASPAICCVGAIDPGFGNVEELSRSEWIDEINDAHPDLLVLALGAERGQAWLMRNSAQLTVPVRTHFGAAVNFMTGKIRRAPALYRRLGLEWLWRIGQEPHLASRYCRDGLLLAQLTLWNVLPMALVQSADRVLDGRKDASLSADARSRTGYYVISLRGKAVGDNITVLEQAFRAAVDAAVPVALDLRGLSSIDVRAIGAIMRFRRDLARRGKRLRLVHVRQRVWRRLQFDAACWLS